MRIRMVGHASVILYTPAGGILCDPWLKGKAFNDSWSLRPEPDFDASLYDDINYIWISHEHPDHFSVATLRGFDDAFKSRVTILFQQKNSTKLFDAMSRWGYKNFQTLPDRADVALPGGVRLACYQIGFLDSLLAITDGEHTVFNVNDTDVTVRDLTQLRKQFGPPDVVLNQFSIAGFDGYKDEAKALAVSARSKLKTMVDTHRILDAKYTVPFASFVYFSAIDNKFINGHANSIGDAVKALDTAGLKSIVLYPSDSYTPGQEWDNSGAVSKLQQAYDTIDQAPFDTPEKISTDDLESAFKMFYANLRRYYPKMLLDRIGTLRWRLEDCQMVVVTDFAAGRFYVDSLAGESDIDVYSQPLHHGLSTPFGFETLAVSGRFHVQASRRRWRFLKAISILYNQGVYLRPRYLLSGATLGYIVERLRHNLIGQILLKRQQRQAMN